MRDLHDILEESHPDEEEKKEATDGPSVFSSLSNDWQNREFSAHFSLKSNDEHQQKPVSWSMLQKDGSSMSQSRKQEFELHASIEFSMRPVNSSSIGGQLQSHSGSNSQHSMGSSASAQSKNAMINMSFVASSSSASLLSRQGSLSSNVPSMNSSVKACENSEKAHSQQVNGTPRSPFNRLDSPHLNSGREENKQQLELNLSVDCQVKAAHSDSQDIEESKSHRQAHASSRGQIRSLPGKKG